MRGMVLEERMVFMDFLRMMYPRLKVDGLLDLIFMKNLDIGFNNIPLEIVGSFLKIIRQKGNVLDKYVQVIVH